MLEKLAVLQELKDLCIYIVENPPNVEEKVCKCESFIQFFDRMLSNPNYGKKETLDWEHIHDVKQSTDALPQILPKTLTTKIRYAIWYWIKTFFKLNSL